MSSIKRHFQFELINEFFSIQLYLNTTRQTRFRKKSLGLDSLLLMWDLWF